jgi:hypothetical protein
MNLKKQHALDLLFGAQLVTVITFFSTRIDRAFETVAGVNLAEQLSINLFCAINLSLAIGAHRNVRSRLSGQIVWANLVSTILTAVFCAVVIYNHYHWSTNDTVTAALSLLGILLVIGVSRLHRLPMIDPIVRGWLGVACKAVPHALFGVKIWQEGSAGMPLIAIITGHLMILSRLTQVAFAVHQEKRWDRNRIGALIGDGAGELAWTAATIAWIMY